MKTILLKSHDQVALRFAMEYLKVILEKNQYNYSFFNRPSTKKRITILKSPHVHKKFKEHYMQKEYTLVLKIYTVDVNIASLLSIVQLNQNSLSITVL